ncbi:hypothetical protein DPMN_052596 [Dreissena polymorpha]|uniref:Nuclear receptor domain-containing protein n=2 Tax=Dreissena polymorpha TaxID=45954 RepID=A0A9D4CLJ9_DREPO|nr:hypothetical protein DPMN_052596 [Dreissena polymorpha]
MDVNDLQISKEGMPMLIPEDMSNGLSSPSSASKWYLVPSAVIEQCTMPPGKLAIPMYLIMDQPTPQTCSQTLHMLLDQPPSQLCNQQSDLILDQSPPQTNHLPSHLIWNQSPPQTCNQPRHLILDQPPSQLCNQSIHLKLDQSPPQTHNQSSHMILDKLPTQTTEHTCRFSSQCSSTRDDMSSCDNSPPSSKSNLPINDVSELNGAKKKTKTKTLDFPPCQICDGESSGVHFGCYTCEACKNFFRRCMKKTSELSLESKKISTPHVCLTYRNCKISYKQSKTNCTACRFKKCIDLGMSSEKVQKGRKSLARRTETITKVKCMERHKESEFQDTIPPDIDLCKSNEAQLGMASHPSNYIEIYGPRLRYGVSDMLKSSGILRGTRSLVEEIVIKLDNIFIWGEDLATEELRESKMKEHYDKYSARAIAFGKMSNVSQEEYHHLLKNYGIDIDNQWEMLKRGQDFMEHFLDRYCDFAKELPNFSKLSLNDQISLLKHAYNGFCIVIGHPYYNSEYKVYIDLNGDVYHTDEISDKFVTRELVNAHAEL